MPTTLELIQEVEKLSPAERIRLIDTIKPDAEIEKIWVKEASARWNAFERDGGETVPCETVMARYRDKR